tara:strand:- start:270141 stop:271031 length:891 start_codon:yes stop_codon:yes gene_type:complete
MGHDMIIKARNRTLADIMCLFWTAKYYIAFFLLILSVMSALWLGAQPHYFRAEMLIGPVEPLFSRSEQPVYESQNIYAGTPLYTMQRKDSTLEFQHFIKMMSAQRSAEKLAVSWPEGVEYFKREKHTVFPWGMRYGLGGLDNEHKIATHLSFILKNRIRIQPDGLTPFYSVTFDAADPDMARVLITSLYNYSDTYLREQAIENAQANLNYLKARLKVEKNSDYRQLLTTLLMQEEYSLMMLHSKSAFAAKIIEAPYVTPYVVWPKPLLIYSGVLMVSFIFGGLFFGLIESVKQRKA